jgi:hypothetical protein
MYTLIIEKKDILAPGTVILSGNFKLVKKIEDLNEFWAVLKHKKSFYARHRIPHLLLSWTLRTIDAWIKAGYFWTVAPCGKPKRANFQLNK